MIFVFPVRLTPMRTSLSLSRTAHFGAANSTRAGWTLPAVKNWNTTFTHPFDCKTVLYSYYFQSVKNYGIAGSNAFVLINCKPWKTRMSFVTCLCYAHNVRLFVSFEYWWLRSGLKKWVIDQAWSQDGLTLATVPFSGFMDRDAVEVHKIAKIERSQYLVTLIEQAWSIKDLLRGFRETFSCGTEWEVLKEQASVKLCFC